MSTAKKGITVADIEKALRANRGNMTAAGNALDVTRQNISQRVAASTTLQALMEELNEVRVDKAEAKLDEAVDRGDLAAVQFMLRTIGKHRGYVEKTQQETTGDMTIRIVDDE